MNQYVLQAKIEELNFISVANLTVDKRTNKVRFGVIQFIGMVSEDKKIYLKERLGEIGLGNLEITIIRNKAAIFDPVLYSSAVETQSGHITFHYIRYLKDRVGR